MFMCEEIPKVLWGHVLVGFSLCKLHCLDSMGGVVLFLPQYYTILEKNPWSVKVCLFTFLFHQRHNTILVS